jgi:hypothetical protein
MDLHPYLLRSIDSRTISSFLLSNEPGFHLAGAGLATANRIARFHLLIVKEFLGFTINRICDRFGRRLRATFSVKED